MGVPIKIPGLERFISEIADGRCVVTEGDLGPSKSVFAARLAATAALRERGVTVVTTGTAEDMKLRMAIAEEPADLEILEIDDWNDLASHLDNGRDLIVDSFSLLAMELDATSIAQTLRTLRASARSNDRIVVLALESGMLSKQQRAVIGHLVDGYLQFHAREDADGLVNYLRIPKWIDGRSHSRNLYFDIEGQRMSIDTRRRVN